MNKKEAREKTLALFKEVELLDPEKTYRSYPHEISGGQKQRVMIAMAIACRPLLLIADEPTTALDVTIQAQILDLIRDLRDRLGTAVVLITHEDEIAARAKRTVRLFDGNVAEDVRSRPLLEASA